MTPKKEHSIDKLFREGLSDYKEKTPEYSWSVISGELNHRRKVRYLRFTKYAAAVVAVLLAFYFGNEFSKKDAVDSQRMANQTMTPQTRANTITPLETKRLYSLNTAPPAKDLTALREVPYNISIWSAITGESQAEENFNEPAVITPLKTLHGDITERGMVNRLDFPDKYFEQLLHQDAYGMLTANNNNGDAVADAATGKWSVGGFFAPLYSYRTTGNEKLGLFNNSYQSKRNTPGAYEGALITYESGLSAEYTVNDTWQFETGVYYSRIGQKKEALSIKNKDLNNRNYQLSTSAGKVDGNKLPNDVSTQIRDTYSTSNKPSDEYQTNTSIDSKLFQKFDYLEIPLIVKYKFYDRKVKLNIVSGLMAGMMIDNTNYFYSNDQKYNLGNTKNLREMLYSTVMGVGMQYDISRKLSINLEPRFKYALHSINSSQEYNYRPYSLGIHSGVSFSF